jgi:uncharacterized protein (DUF4415 family)
MSRKIVKRKVNLSGLPQLSRGQKAQLASLKNRPETAIDYSDIPSVADGLWQGAERGRFYKPVKTSTTLRIDADVLAWLRSQGKGYQSRINAILRRTMMDAVKR